jgi:hypothetical protein
MRLFIFQPRGIGESAFYVIAENEKEAFKIIDNHIKSKYPNDSFEVGGWSTDYYQVFVKEVGEVFEQENS